jgi:HD-GYP domain-containing protein (c-di-GMP phosphodiesterase class II)
MALALAQGEQWRRMWRRQAAATRHERRTDRVYQETLKALGSALDTRDPETQEHATRVVTNALRLGKALEMSRQALVALERGAVLHDVGKIGVPDGILMKPARLSNAEWHCMRSHAEIGYDMLASISFLAEALPIIRFHHENYDGSGYPEGLSGEDIPPGARLFAVVDALDAMTSDRPYRRAMPLAEAVAEITRCAGTQFDPAIVAALVRLVDSGEWPQDGKTVDTGH